MLKKTKIVCTLGPASSDEQVMRQMLEAGMNVARLNFFVDAGREWFRPPALVAKRVLRAVRFMKPEAGFVR